VTIRLTGFADSDRTHCNRSRMVLGGVDEVLSKEGGEGMANLPIIPFHGHPNHGSRIQVSDKPTIRPSGSLSIVGE
jgi:hypothetical protein